MHVEINSFIATHVPVTQDIVELHLLPVVNVEFSPKPITTPGVTVVFTIGLGLFVYTPLDDWVCVANPAFNVTLVTSYV